MLRWVSRRPRVQSINTKVQPVTSIPAGQLSSEQVDAFQNADVRSSILSWEINSTMPDRHAPDANLIEMAARLADLPLLATANCRNSVPAMAGFYGLLDNLHRGDLKETPPAIGFRAKWAGR
jgi:hypothetical protein